MNIKEVAAKYADYQIEMRRYFHKHPEVSGKEFETSKAVKAELDKMGIPYRDCGMGTGVLATIEGTKPGKTILLRADMDALTVHETTGAEYASVNEGVMHACGHDCHISMLLTAAHILMDMREELCGTVRLAFQPAEEIALGAIAMIDEGAMDGVDGCFGIHVWTDVAAGTVSIEGGPRMASCDSFNIKITGKGCHGAQPEAGVDAAVVTAAVINNLQTIVSREISPMDNAVVTVGTIQTGTRWNVVAENSVLAGTTRAFRDEIRDSFEERISRVVKSTCESFRAKGEVEYIRMVSPTINDYGFAALAQESAKKIMGEDCLANFPATTGAEDFSQYLYKAPGAMVFLGTGNPECGAIWPNHSGNFCVDEDQLLKGAMLHAQVALDFNASK